MRLMRGRSGGTSTRRSDTFEGGVWSDPVLPATDGVTINVVFFAPGSRTFWHHHENGQILQVTAGQGWVCRDGDEPVTLSVGDVVWVPPGELHWHGASADSYLVHTATSLGATVWAERVPGRTPPSARTTGKE
jgi:quercetin dioxygenase-like cupin family protein